MKAELDTTTLRFAPLTADRWDDVAKLFGPNGACGGCWCMWWKRTQRDFDRAKGAINKRAFKAIVSRGTEPGLLAYAGDTPIGWCAVEPREHYLRLVKSRTLAPVDEQHVWSITCLFIKAGYRHQGVSLALIEAATAFVAARGGRLIEAYPKDLAFKTAGANSLWMGVASTFRQVQFEEVARRTPTRPIMRIEVAARGAGKAQRK
jgi:GNAT superfamily N-acetyltransferase